MHLEKSVGENGFFVNFDQVLEVKVDEIKTNAPNKKKTIAEMPEGNNIKFYRGLASQRFGLGEKSGNGYKILPEGIDFTRFNNNPVLLLQHNTKEPIGRVLSTKVTENGVEIEYYIDFNAVDDKNSHRIKTGLINGISTGHHTREEKVEDNKTGKLMSFDEWMEEHDPEFDDYLDLVMGRNNDFTLVVTKSEVVEISPVTIPSNPDALTARNSLNSYFTKTMKNEKKFNELKTSLGLKKNTEGGSSELTDPVQDPIPSPVPSVNESNMITIVNEIDAIKNENTELKNEMEKLKNAFSAMGNHMITMNEEFNAVEAVVNHLPAKKAMIAPPKKNSSSDFAELLGLQK